MKISLNWLQCYFDKPLPAPEKMAELFTFGLCEVEGVEKIAGVDGKPGSADTIFDMKILPDRACYALSHRGIASEIAALALMPMKPITKPPFTEASTKTVSVKNLAPEICTRYVARYIENVTVGNTPDWPRLWLEAIGQRSINTVVDATNTVMFDIGQPLHAFDADKVKGSITIRFAKAGEKMTTLDSTSAGAKVAGKVIELAPDMLVIADDEGPLAIAGVKGGSRAGVTESTKNLILESACFDPVSVRKTSAKVGIHNESSKRFENNVTPHLAPDAMDWLVALILEQSKGAKVGPVTDIHGELPAPVSFDVSVEQIHKILGINIPAQTMVEFLGRVGVVATTVGAGAGDGADKMTVSIPHNRLDLRIPADIAEEVGRLYGYDKIPAPVPPLRALDAVNKTFYYSEKIKNILLAEGFSEVYGYSLVPKGDYDVAKPLASDKGALRTDLASSLAASLKMNVLNADLVGLDAVCLFEIGAVFTAERESIHLALACEQVKKVKGKKGADLVKNALAVLERELGVSLAPASTATAAANANVAEISLDEIIEKLPTPASYTDPSFAQLSAATLSVKYQPFSVYPFIVRDVAVFVPGEADSNVVLSVIEQSLEATGGAKLIARKALFDVFTKKSEDGSTKTSYAYRFVFQAKDRTLSDAEIAVIMDAVYAALKGKGWEIR